MEKWKEELPLARWLIDETNTDRYRQGILKGEKHRKVTGKLLKVTGGKRELVRQAKILENIPELGGKEYLKFDWRDMDKDIKAIHHKIELMPRLCKLIGVTDSRERQIRAIEKTQELRRKSEGGWLSQYCDYVLEQLNRGKTDVLVKIEDDALMHCLLEMNHLKGAEWKRVFSARVFEMTEGIPPSKVFEKIYQGKILEVLRHSPKYKDSMTDEELLTVHGILTYSQTLEWKGPLCYQLLDEAAEAPTIVIDTAMNRYGTMINAQTLEHAEPISLNEVEKIVIIENKANYESMRYNPKILYIFCHGYFSPKEVQFLKAVREIASSEINYYHWGDLDYGGIQIFLYNEKNIFPDLIPWRMDADSYKLALNKGNGIALTDKKREKLEALDAGKLESLKVCLLENGVEIEQEIQMIDRC